MHDELVKKVKFQRMTEEWLTQMLKNHANSADTKGILLGVCADEIRACWQEITALNKEAEYFKIIADANKHQFAQITELRAEIASLKDERAGRKEYDIKLIGIIDRLKAQLTEARKAVIEWSPVVEDGYPARHQLCVVLTKDGDMRLDNRVFSQETNFEEWGSGKDDVVRWLPIPDYDPAGSSLISEEGKI